MIHDPGTFATPGDVTSGHPASTYDTSGPVIGTSNAAEGYQRVATAKSAHQMIVATGIMIVAVYLLVIVAGISQGAGRAVLALFALAIVLWGLSNPASVLRYIQTQPLTPKEN
jgi:hypothetical protein